MAFYGDIFLDPGAQGTMTDRLDPPALELAEGLAHLWLEAAAERAGSEQDRREAARVLRQIDYSSPGAQGLAAAFRPTLNGLSKLRWFAPFGYGLAAKFVWRAVSQVALYLDDDRIRQKVQSRLLNLIDSDTKLVIGHSLGSVVAYETLHHATGRTALLTLGSPLGLKSVVYDKLRPAPPMVPEVVTRWDNIVDRDDLIAARLDLSKLFAPHSKMEVVPTTHPSVDNGSRPHDATRYLTKPTTGSIIGEILSA
ncbi:hypothetical protein [Nocardia sp. NPDC057227]|uniref:hypothetical protein n=1 Tax=Nocardia sp. NPDC057227 TaxID=3346056 RepID=UPI00363AB186